MNAGDCQAPPLLMEEEEGRQREEGQKHSGTDAPHPAASLQRSDTTSSKIEYLDGLRGYAAFTVVVHHWLDLFFPSLLNLYWPIWHDRGVAEYNGLYPTGLGGTPLSFFFDGGFAVALFFALSGRVLLASYYAKAEPKHSTIVSAAFRRIIRLGMPPLFTGVLWWVMAKAGLLYNKQAAAITKSEFMSQPFYGPDLEQQSLWTILRFISSVFTNNHMSARPVPNKYNVEGRSTNVLWTMRFEFRASMMLFFLGPIARAVEPRSRWLLYAILAWWFSQENYWYVPFMLGLALCDAETTHRAALDRLVGGECGRRATLGLWAARALLGFVWFSAGSWNMPFWPNTEEARICLGPLAALMLLAVTPQLQALFASRIFIFLGYISFSMYLCHPLVMFSLGAYAFTRFYEHDGLTYVQAGWATLAVMLPPIIALSYLMTKVVDEPSVRLARVLYEQLFTSKNQMLIDRLQRGSRWMCCCPPADRPEASGGSEGRDAVLGFRGGVRAEAAGVGGDDKTTALLA